MSPNLRTYKKYDSPVVRKRKRRQEQQPEEKSAEKRSHKKKIRVDQRGRTRNYGNATTDGLNCYGRNNLSKYLRFFPDEGTIHDRRPRARRISCRFCGRQRIMFKCLACNEVFCMAPPHNLIIPGSDPPTNFSVNGPLCWHLLHGFSKWSEVP